MIKTLIQTPTPSMSKSLDFYKLIEFDQNVIDGTHYVNDGVALVEINDQRTARAGLKMFAGSWSGKLERLGNRYPIHKTKDGYLISSVSGVWIELVENSEGVNISLSTNCKSILGNYAGFSLESIDLKKSIAFWNLFDFSKTMGGLEQGWVALSNKDGIGISIMAANACPHLFYNPSLTYFNGKENLRIIQEIRDKQIPITEEITVFNKEGIVDNIIIRDPGGVGFFIFSD